MKQMCPIRRIKKAIRETAGDFDANTGAGCFAACTWYDHENECCAILTIAQRIGGRDDGEE